MQTLIPEPPVMLLLHLRVITRMISTCGGLKEVLVNAAERS